MSESYHHIRRLYLEKLTGTISEEEDFELGELLRTDLETQRTWDLLEKERRELDVDIILSQIDPERELEEWKNRLPEKEEIEEEDPATVPLWGNWWRWAAAAVVFAVAGSYFFQDMLPWRDRQEGEVTVTQPDETAKIKLLLADGNSITFSKDSAEAYTVGGVQLENSGNQLRYAGENQEAIAFNTLEVPATKDYSITLSDGTRVFLNSETTLRFPFYFNGETREVFIDGEAYLEVAKNAEKPFIVHTPLTDIHVLGTQFNVNTYHEGMVLTSLVEGNVSLRAANSEPLKLLPGQEASYSPAKGFDARTFDAAEVLAWRKGIYYFQDQPLEELSGMISRWFDVEVVFERKSLARHAVSGMLEKGHLEEFLHDLNRTSGINYTLSSASLTLK